MRQNLGPKKVAKIREATGLPVVSVLVRGGTGHRMDLCLEDGTVWNLWADGTVEPELHSDGTPMRWHDPNKAEKDEQKDERQ